MTADTADAAAVVAAAAAAAAAPAAVAAAATAADDDGGDDDGDGDDADCGHDELKYSHIMAMMNRTILTITKKKTHFKL